MTVDVVEFEELARRALADGDVARGRRARSALYGGELLPEDRYEDWAEERREQLRLRHLDLLRLDGRWDRVVELDPGDEVAHVALMREHAADGDRHAALRQFDRHRPGAAARARRRCRARGASRSAIGCSPSRTSVPPPADDALVGRESRARASPSGRCRCLGRTGPHV